MTTANGLPDGTRAVDAYRSGALPALVERLPRDRHPVAVYLAMLSESGRRTMAQALGHCAELLSGGAADAESLDWSRVRIGFSLGIEQR